MITISYSAGTYEIYADFDADMERDTQSFDVIKDVPENRSKDKRFERMQLVRNMVNPEIGLYVLNCAVGDFNKKFEPQTLFGNEM